MDHEVRSKDKVQDAFGTVLLSFAKEPDFKEKGPAVLFYQRAGSSEVPNFSIGEPPPAPEFYDRAVSALEEASGRAIFRKGLVDGVPFLSLRCGDDLGTILVLFGWNWEDAHAFLVIFATQMGLDMPSSLRLTTEARNRLPPSTRALLFF